MSHLRASLFCSPEEVDDFREDTESYSFLQVEIMAKRANEWRTLVYGIIRREIWCSFVINEGAP